MPQLKGVILAAGLGSRLRPLTDTMPKPLLPFCGVPIFYLAMSRLLQAGVDEIAANAHYLPELIERAAKKNPFSLNIHISLETERILGTGGVYGNLHRWREQSALLAINGDIVSDFDLGSLNKAHLDKKAWVTLGLVKGANPGGKSVWIDTSGRVVAISVNKPGARADLSPHIFSGFQVLSDEILNVFQKDTEADLISTFQRGLTAGKLIHGVYQDCFWHDLGTPTSYFLAHKEFLDGRTVEFFESTADAFGYNYAAKKMALKLQYFRESQLWTHSTILAPSLFVGDVKVGANSTIGPYVIADGDIEIAANSKVSTCIILGAIDPVHKDSLRQAIMQNGLITQIDA